IALRGVANFFATAGGGVSGRVNGREILAGTAQFLAQRGIAGADAQLRGTGESADAAGTVILVAVEGVLAAALTLRDQLKATTPDAIRNLRAEGLRIVMLTGDS